MKNKYLIYIILLAIIGACKPELEEFEASSGSADFSSYLAIGNSISAGFSDGALFKSAQMNSYPAIIARQFQMVGGGDFKQPILDYEPGVRVLPTQQGLVFTTKNVLGYVQNCLGETSLAPKLADPNASQQELQNILLSSVANQGPFNNISVPGAKSIHMFFPGLGLLNPYYGRFAQNPQTDMLIDEAAKIDFTFFTIWMGNNDVLQYALGGGVGDIITPPDQFNGAMDNLLATVTANGAKGAIGNIPDFKTIPFFTTIPFNSLQLTAEQAGLLNAAYDQYNMAVIINQLPVDTIHFTEGYNAFIIADTSFPYNMIGGLRQIKPGELVLLSVPQDSLLCAGWGSQKPIPNEYTLIEPEINAIDDAIAGYNQKIDALVAGYPLAFVDVYSIYDKIDNDGMIIDGVSFTSELVTGNLFSLDGVHLTQQGAVIVANHFIDAINQTYGANIPKANVTDYPSVIFP